MRYVKPIVAAFIGALLLGPVGLLAALLIYFGVAMVRSNANAPE